MGFWSFILGVASTVLSGVITDLITNKSKAARKKEIEHLVTLKLLEHSKKQDQDLETLKHAVMNEIETLSSRDPDLNVARDRIELKRSIRDRLLPRRSQSAVRTELLTKLRRLDKIVEERRRELNLPTSLEQNVELENRSRPDQSVSPERNVRWTKHIDRERTETQWSREIKDMEERIHRRRYGKEVYDED